MTTKAKPDTFASRLKSLREKAGLSQAALAEQAGLAQTAVSHLERGAREPAWDTVCKIADALGVKIDALRTAIR